MKEQILSNLDNPLQLEKLYRADRSAFKGAFKTLYPELQGNPLAAFWSARLNYVKEEISWGTGKDFLFLVIASLIAGSIAKLPFVLGIEEEFFYSRNIGFIIFPVLSAYFAWKNKLSAGKIAFISVVTLTSLVFINSLPNLRNSDTIILSCIHLAFLLWSMLGFAFVNDNKNNVGKRISFLKYNGDLVVMTTLIVIAGGIVTAVTIGLFELIEIDIADWYFENVVVFGLPIAPILGTYLTQTNPQLVGKVSPVIAKLFSPVVLVMLVIYLVALIYTGFDPYYNRGNLMLFNGLLIGVMAIIFFSIAGTSKTKRNLAENWVLFLLSCVTIIVNGIAMSAILFRIAEWGITANRAAVLGSNILILINLVLVAWELFGVISKKTNIDNVERSISFYLPVYAVWAIIVTFIFPFIFGY
jgi:hypothetical protein